MSYHLVDVYSPKQSTIHRLDARYKLLTLMALVLVIIRLQHLASLVAALSVLVMLLLVSRVSPAYVAARLLLAVPFMGFLLLVPFATPGEVIWHYGFVSLSAEGLARAGVLALRVVAALLTITLLSATTRFNELMEALASLRVPTIFIDVAHFSIRYVSVLGDEIARMRRAQKSRGFAPGSILRWSTLGPLSRLVGMAFVRALERGERVHRAMRARNYQGRGLKHTSQFHAGLAEFTWVGVIVTVAALLVIVERGVSK